MSTQSLANTPVEHWHICCERYQELHPGPFSVRRFTKWAVQEKLVDLPEVDPMRMLIKTASEAVKKFRVRDKQNRLVREMLPARVPVEVDENGNGLLFEVRYDHIHTMSTDHALLVFEQKDENINKQQRSATRELQSFLDNNPNGAGRQKLFQFGFVQDATQQQVVQTISETTKKPNKPR